MWSLLLDNWYESSRFNNSTILLGKSILNSIFVFHNSSEDASLGSKCQALLGLWASGSQGILCSGHGRLVDGVDSSRYKQKHFILCYSPTIYCIFMPIIFKKVLNTKESTIPFSHLIACTFYFIHVSLYRALWRGSRSVVPSKLFKEATPFVFMHSCMHCRTLLSVYYGPRTILEAMVRVANLWRWVGESLYFLFILGVYIWFLFELVLIPKH